MLLLDWDQNIVARCNSLNVHPLISKLFSVISRLGDGVFWYCLLIAVAVCDADNGLAHAGILAISGFSGTLIYKALKGSTARLRPCEQHKDFFLTVDPLDRFSFPSGHTLHATIFTVLAVHFYAWLAPLLIPFTCLIALSRLILGLHYPSDVLAGAVIGLVVAEVALFII